MRLVLGVLSQIFFMSFASGALFMVSSVVAPLKTAVIQPASHLPRMNISFTDFSLPLAALEDDYNVGEMQDEEIPQNIPARTLEAGKVEMNLTTPVLKLPMLKVQKNAVFDLSQVSELSQNPQALLTSSQAQANKDIQHPHFWIEGRIELTDGLALSSSTDVIHVGWMLDDKIQREGRVSIADGRYSIKVDRLQGEVIAELVDDKGYVMGEAAVDLDKLFQQYGTSRLTIDNVDLRLTPYNFGFKARTLSVYDTPSSRDPIAGATVSIGNHDLHLASNERGDVEAESLSSRSTGILSAAKSGYRETVVIADFTKAQNLRLFPEKYIKALFDSIDFPDEFRDLGVVWGRVVHRGVPAGGYRVRLSQHRDVGTVYFETYIPMEQNKETSSDGQYAIVGLEEGHYEIEVVDSLDKVIDTKLVYIKPGAISTVEFEVARTKTLYVKYFDPFRTQVRPMEYVTLGQSAMVNVETETSVPVTAYMGDDPLLVFSRLENAEVGSASFASRSMKYQEIPVLDYSWFEKVAQTYKIDKQKGAIVGFVDTQEEFQVYLDKMVLDYQVLYFDIHGDIIKPHEVGRQRAGFIFYNTSTDLHTVLIESSSGAVVSELAYVDGESVALLYKSL